MEAKVYFSSQYYGEHCGESVYELSCGSEQELRSEISKLIRRITTYDVQDFGLPVSSTILHKIEYGDGSVCFNF